MSLVCYAAAHALVRAKVRTSQPGSGVGRKCLLLSLPRDARGSDFVAVLSHSHSQQPGPCCPLRPRDTINLGYKLQWRLSSSRSGVERLLLLLQHSVHEACLRWRIGKVSFFYSQGVLALKTEPTEKRVSRFCYCSQVFASNFVI